MQEYLIVGKLPDNQKIIIQQNLSKIKYAMANIRINVQG